MRDWLLFDENMGESLSIDETCLSSGEVYTFLTNKAGKGGRGTLVAVVRGTKAEDVIRVLEKIDLSKRKTVKEITLDLSSSMMIIARTVFPKALITSDRFHVQKLYYDALDDMRIAYRWTARDKENEEMKEAKAKNETYKPFRYSNGDTRKQLLARAKFILTKHKSKWTESQRLRAEIIFENYPELKKAYDLAMELTDIYNARSIKDAARLKLARWFNKVEKLGVDNFYTVIDTFKNHYDTILNFFVNRATNANAGIFNAKVKALGGTVQGSNGYSFLPLQAYEIMCMRGEGCNWVLRLTRISQIDFWLDERNFMEEADRKSGTVSSYGFTAERVVQDFPLRGKPVYLHVRRRKWRDSSTGEIFSYSYDDLTAEGSKLSPEFVSF